MGKSKVQSSRSLTFITHTTGNLILNHYAGKQTHYALCATMAASAHTNVNRTHRVQLCLSQHRNINIAWAIGDICDAGMYNSTRMLLAMCVLIIYSLLTYLCQQQMLKYFYLKPSTNIPHSFVFLYFIKVRYCSLWWLHEKTETS